MGSMTKQIARRKAKNIQKTEDGRFKKFKTKDGRYVKNTAGESIYLTRQMDSPRTKIIELKRLAKEKKEEIMSELIDNYKKREQRNKKRIDISKWDRARERNRKIRKIRKLKLKLEKKSTRQTQRKLKKKARRENRQK